MVVWAGLLGLLMGSVGCGGPEPPQGCQSDTDCATNQTCQSGTCIDSSTPGTCKSAADCGPGKTCKDGTCKKAGCEDGATRPCYEGPEGTQDKGTCKTGTQTCKGGIWDTCQGQTLPGAEICNGKDDNCDGTVDEGRNCTCSADERESCYSGPDGTKGVGVCQAGTRYCDKDGTWGPCLRESLPHAEVCDNKDNDCNGQTDESFPGKGDPCPTGKFGACALGAKACEQGQIVCAETIKPGQEVCDQKDNDCDGQIDEDGVCATCEEGRERTCYTGPANTQGKGICKTGRSKCVNGKWSPCLGEVKPDAEKCGDNVDNNCNGAVDENCVECKQGEQRACYTGKTGCARLANQKFSCFAPCQTGSQTCFGGKWGPCQGDITPVPETCNGKDDNCDGTVDEGCTCKTGEQRFCYSGPSQTRNKGECKAGVQTCDPQGKWGPCQGEVKPQAETCDGKDNDCDGTIDNFSRTCYGGPAGSETRGECSAGAQTCNNGTWSPCRGEVKPQPETCDGKDNDCDGAVDGFSRPCYGGSKGCTPDGQSGYTCQGFCRSGFQQCNSGRWSVCAGQRLPSPEICNGLDDDCDGAIDGITEPCYNAPDTGCTKNSQGAYTCQGQCKAGQRTCTNSQWSACQNQAIAANETCDGKDNDCDGSIDNFQRKCWTGNATNRNQGLCQDGLEQCTNGQWSACQNQILPKVEACNGKDDDCDGSIDEELTPPPCKLQQGVCANKVQTCGGAQGWQPCTATQYGSDYEANETTCDNKDNDCDGTVDGAKVCGTCFGTQVAAKAVSSLPSSCGTQQQCQEDCLSYQGQLYYCRNINNGGYKYITYQAWLNACTPQTACDTSQCHTKSFFCTGASWREGSKPGSNDDFCDGIDNNCNGTVDEDCTCGSPCTADTYCQSPCGKCVLKTGQNIKVCAP